MSVLLIDQIINDMYAKSELDWDQTMNQNLVRTGLLLARAVKSVGSNAPVAGADNDRHIIGTAPTGVWAGHPAEMARQNAAAVNGYDFLVVPNDIDVLNYGLAGPGAAGLYRKAAGVWVAVGSGAPSPHAASHLPAGSDSLLWGTTLGIHGVGTLAGRPAASAANANLLYFATDDQGGRLFRSDGVAWTSVAPPKTGNLQQVLSASQAGAASIAATAYANLINVPITTIAGSKLTVWASIAARNTVGINAVLRGRVRVDGLVTDPTAVGRGFSQTAPILTSNIQTGICIQITGLGAGAHVINFDWSVAAAAQTISVDPTTNPNVDHATLIVEETLV